MTASTDRFVKVFVVKRLEDSHYVESFSHSPAEDGGTRVAVITTREKGRALGFHTWEHANLLTKHLHGFRIQQVRRLT